MVKIKGKLFCEYFLLTPFSEPAIICELGYGHGSFAPGHVESGAWITPYKCANTIIKAHGLAYRIYEREFKAQQGGQVGITLNTDWNEPAQEDEVHNEASDRALRFYVRDKFKQ